MLTGFLCFIFFILVLATSVRGFDSDSEDKVAMLLTSIGFTLLLTWHLLFFKRLRSGLVANLSVVYALSLLLILYWVFLSYTQTESQAGMAAEIILFPFLIVYTFFVSLVSFLYHRFFGT